MKTETNLDDEVKYEGEEEKKDESPKKPVWKVSKISMMDVLSEVEDPESGQMIRVKKERPSSTRAKTKDKTLRRDLTIRKVPTRCDS